MFIFKLTGQETIDVVTLPKEFDAKNINSNTGSTNIVQVPYGVTSNGGNKYIERECIVNDPPHFRSAHFQSKYEVGKKYCRRCEVYFLYDRSFCPCCGMTLRLSPVNKKDRNRLRKNTHS